MLQLVKDLSPSGIFFLFLLLSLFELALTHAQPLTLALRCSALPHPPPFLSRLTSKFILNIFIIQTYFPSLLFPFSTSTSRHPTYLWAIVLGFGC